MFQSSIIIKVENHVKRLFLQRSVVNNIYHNISHTEEVVRAAEEIAWNEKINSNEIELLLISAWFHDIGYFHCCKGHEDQSSEYARDFLVNEKVTDSKINIVLECIKSTKIPQNPKSKIEEILCDADLLHLGYDDFSQRGNLLRIELESNEIKKFSDLEWLQVSLDFIKKHRFFTETAKMKYEKQKQLNILWLEKEIKGMNVIST